MIKFFRHQANNFYLFHRYPVSKQFVKFCLVGFTNLAVEMLCYWILTRILHLYYILAAILAFLVAVTWSFSINRRWTFRHNGKEIHKQYVKFFIANSISALINLFLLFLAVDFLKMNDILAKFIASFIVAFFNFTINKLWTFRE